MRRHIAFLLIFACLTAATVGEAQAKDTQGDPSRYVGAWSGDVTSNAGGEPTRVDLSLVYDDGSIHGSIAYAGLGCDGYLEAPDNQLRTTPDGQVVSSGGEGVLMLAHLDDSSGAPLCLSNARFTVSYYDAAYFGQDTLVVDQIGSAPAGSAHGSLHRNPSPPAEDTSTDAN
jgi:hypothetical protein